MNEYVEQFVLKLPDESKCDENTDSPEMVIFRLFLVLHIYKFKTRFCICNMEMSSSPCLQMWELLAPKWRIIVQWNLTEPGRKFLAQACFHLPMDLAETGSLLHWFCKPIAKPLEAFCFVKFFSYKCLFSFVMTRYGHPSFTNTKPGFVFCQCEQLDKPYQKEYKPNNCW